jgi:hypothetical protein
VGLPEGASWPVPGKLGALILQALRENVKADFSADSIEGKGLRVTIGFSHNPPPKTSN